MPGTDPTSIMQEKLVPHINRKWGESLLVSAAFKFDGDVANTMKNATEDLVLALDGSIERVEHTMDQDQWDHASYIVAKAGGADEDASMENFKDAIAQFVEAYGKAAEEHFRSEGKFGAMHILFGRSIKKSSKQKISEADYDKGMESIADSIFSFALKTLVEAADQIRFEVEKEKTAE